MPSELTDEQILETARERLVDLETEHDVKSMLYADKTTQLEARIADLEAERDDLQTQLKETMPKGLYQAVEDKLNEYLLKCRDSDAANARLRKQADVLADALKYMTIMFVTPEEDAERRQMAKDAIAAYNAANPPLPDAQSKTEKLPVI